MAEPVVDPHSWPEVSKRIYQDAVASSARRLREMADAFEREALRTNHSYVYALGRAQHALLWGLANASTDSLVKMAEDVDTAARSGT